MIAVCHGCSIKETAGNSVGTADRLGAILRCCRGLIGWTMSAKAQRSDSASDHSRVLLTRNQSEAGAVTESDIMGVNCGLPIKLMVFIINYAYCE